MQEGAFHHVSGSKFFQRENVDSMFLDHSLTTPLKILSKSIFKLIYILISTGMFSKSQLIVIRVSYNRHLKCNVGLVAGYKGDNKIGNLTNIYGGLNKR